MIRFAAFVFSFLALPAAAASAQFRAPGLPAPEVVRFGAPEAKRASQQPEERDGRVRVGDVRPLAKAAAMPAWVRLDGGYLSRARVSSSGAAGLRTRLDLGAMPGVMEVRVRGGDRVETMALDPDNGPQAWTPWTEGDTQEIEIYSAVAPADDALRVGAVVHFTASPFAKAAGACTVSTSCSTGNATLDAAMAQAKKSVMKLTFIDAGGSFLCTGTLLQTERAPAPYVVTANHCIDNAASAASISTWWFYESLGCGSGGLNPNWVQVGGGMQMVFGNFNVDSTLLLMNGTPPAGAVYAPFTRQHLASGAQILSLSHPDGDTSRLAQGNIRTELRLIGRPQDVYAVRFTRGIIQGGSSGSGLFTLSGGALQFAGVLSGTTVNQPGGMSCSNPDEDALYSRFDIFGPQIDQYIRVAAQAPDDAPNRPQDLFGFAPDANNPTNTPINQRGSVLAIDNRRIDYAGDLDVYRFSVTGTSVVSAWTEGGNLDTVGAILDSRGVSLETNDDADASNNHFGITRTLTPGTYYVQVGHYEPQGTGAYNLRIRSESVEAHNYSDLWGTPGESGWGLTLSHQDNTIFGSIYTYDAAGAPMWLVMSGGDRQPDCSYAGTLYRATGPAFNTVPWRDNTLVAVGTMRLAFSGADNGTLTYTFDGVTVTKSIARFTFSTKASCSWSAFDRAFTDNFQDLWWNPAERGWGLNIAHQGDTLFAALFTYDSSGRDIWLYMSNGAKNGDDRYSGTLYRSTGPAFNASPWTAATPTAVGNMTLQFTNGNSGTLTYTFNGVTVTKSIVRDVFGAVRVQCES